MGALLRLLWWLLPTGEEMQQTFHVEFSLVMERFPCGGAQTALPRFESDDSTFYVVFSCICRVIGRDTFVFTWFLSRAHNKCLI